ncbi:TetR/AcrR family transcriptional regulator, partial [Priestia megaterium]
MDGIQEIVEQGRASGEFKADLDAEAVAMFTLSLLEGGIMLSRLEGSNRPMQLNIESYSSYL